MLLSTTYGYNGKRMKATLEQHGSKIAYLIVGGWNTVFGYGAFSLLYHLFSQRFHFVFILIVSYVLSITNAYTGYKVFVFRTKGNVLREYLRFYAVYGGSFLLNLILLPFFMNSLLLNAYISQAIIMAVTIIGSYVIHKKYTFGKDKGVHAS